MSPSSHEFRERIEETLLYFGKYLNICRVPEYVSGTWISVGYLNMCRVPEYMSGTWISVGYLNMCRVPEYVSGTWICVGYLIIYGIFARLLSNLHEIQYKTFERNAVEHVLVWA